jgi:hypothetical protein
MNQVLIRLSKGLFAYQIFLVATPRPSMDALLDQSIASGREKGEAFTSAAR